MCPAGTENIIVLMWRVHGDASDLRYKADGSAEHKAILVRRRRRQRKEAWQEGLDWQKEEEEEEEEEGG